MIARALLTLIFASFALITGSAAQGPARDQPVGIGDIAPDFTLMDQNGIKRSLSGERGKRPVVLVFYRGHW